MKEVSGGHVAQKSKRLTLAVRTSEAHFAFSSVSALSPSGQTGYVQHVTRANPTGTDRSGCRPTYATRHAARYLETIATLMSHDGHCLDRVDVLNNSPKPPARKLMDTFRARARHVSVSHDRPLLLHTERKTSTGKTRTPAERSNAPQDVVPLGLRTDSIPRGHSSLVANLVAARPVHFGFGRDGIIQFSAPTVVVIIAVGRRIQISLRARCIDIPPSCHQAGAGQALVTAYDDPPTPNSRRYEKVNALTMAGAGVNLHWPEHICRITFYG